jgi:hypothetical protein
MILNAFSKLWEEWIPADQIQGFKIHGCFWIDLTNNLRGISFNTLYLFNSNTYSDDCTIPTSPGYVVLAWLDDILSKSEFQKKRIFISGNVFYL